MLTLTSGRSTVLRTALMALLLGLAQPGGALAASMPGTLDPAFGTGGVATMPFTTSADFASGATGAHAAFVTGVSVRGNTRQLFLAKFLADGTLDSTFAASGPTPGRTMLRLDHPTEGRQVRQQVDGKLVVVGTHHVLGASELLVARFHGDGSLDTTFGVNGTYRRRLPLTSTSGDALDIQANGKILVAASVSGGSGNDIAVLCLNVDGSPDLTFGVDGVRSLDFRLGFDAPRAIVATTGGKILMAGSSANAPSGDYDYSIARLDIDGSLDTTFGPAGQGGLVLVDMGGGHDDLSSMIVAGGSIWLSGTSYNADSSSSMAIAKLTSEGLLDASFNGTGRSRTAGGSSTVGASLALVTGHVLVGGSNNSRFAVARFIDNGALDVAFGVGGLLTDADLSAGGITALVTYPDGSFLAVGAVHEPGPNFLQDIARVRFAATGLRDPAFGNNGKTITNLFNLSWDIRAVSAEPDGKIVIAGSIFDDHDADFAVVRLNANGARDTSVGRIGIQTVYFPNGFDHAYAMLRQADGKRVIAGSNNRNGTAYFALTRLHAGLSLDQSFGTTGRTTHTMGIGYAEILALAEAPDGKIVAAGYAVSSSTDYDFAIARYSANGVLDASFGSGGVVLTSFGSGRDVANAVAVQPDGKIVAAGYMRVGNLFDFALARYNLNGTLDTTFGNGGRVVIPVGIGNDIARSVTILPTGKILVAGEASYGSSTGIDMVVARLNANGTLDDTTFADAGVAVVDFAQGHDVAIAMAVQRNGKIVVAGNAFADGPAGAQRAFGVARFTAGGGRDTAFGTNGRTANDITALPDTFFAVALQRDGKILAAGNAGTQWGVVRYFGDARAVATDLNGDTRSDIVYRNIADGRVQRMLMNGFTITSNEQAHFEPNLAWRIVGDGDFNGDGIADLLWRNDSDGRIYMMPFTASGTVGPGGVIYSEPSIAWKIVATPDVDGDGKSDIVWWNSNTGEVYVMLVNGLTLGARGLMYTEPDLAWRIVASGDFAGSGKQNQLLWRNAADGRVFLMTVSVVGSTFGHVGQMIYAESNLAWKIIGAADFNSDARSDILWRNDATGEVFMMLMNGATIVDRGIVYAESNLDWKIVAQGDYNADGKADILYRNTSTGQVYMILMNGLARVDARMVYTEANLAWKLLGPYEYSQ